MKLNLAQLIKTSLKVLLNEILFPKRPEISNCFETAIGICIYFQGNQGIIVLSCNIQPETVHLYSLKELLIKQQNAILLLVNPGDCPSNSVVVDYVA